MILFMNKADILQQKILKSKPSPKKRVSPYDDLTPDKYGIVHAYDTKYPGCEEDEDTTSLTSISSSRSDDSSDDDDIYSQYISERNGRKSRPFNRFFPDYTGDPYDLPQVQKFLIAMFDSVRRLKHKRLFSHCTTAVDTENIKIVFNDVRMTILQKNINALMLQ